MYKTFTKEHLPHNNGKITSTLYIGMLCNEYMVYT